MSAMTTATNSNDPKQKYKDLPLVPETILKKRHDLDELRRKRAAAAEQALQKSGGKKPGKGGKKGVYVKKLESLVARAQSRRNGQIRYNRVLKKGMQTRASNKKVMATRELEEIEVDSDEEEDDEKVKDPTAVSTPKNTITYQANSVGAPMVFVIRVRDHHGACPMVKRALSRMRLRNINEGVFVRYDANHRKLLHLVEPWVVYGPPTKAVVEDLMERRGFGSTNVDGRKQRVALSDNTIIEQALGDDCGVICTEDLVHEICTVGPAFSKVTRFLWPFRLSHKSSHFERATLKFTLGKDYGDKGERINDFVRQML